MPYKDPDVQKEAKKQWYQKNKHRIKGYNKKRKENFFTWWYEYKSQFSCEHCRESDIVCLDFHHKHPSKKNYDIQYLVHSRNKTNLLKELKMCICLCANCHRRQHHKESLKEERGHTILAEPFRKIYKG